MTFFSLSCLSAWEERQGLVYSSLLCCVGVLSFFFFFFYGKDVHPLSIHYRLPQLHCSSAPQCNGVQFSFSLPIVKLRLSFVYLLPPFHIFIWLLLLSDFLPFEWRLKGDGSGWEFPSQLLPCAPYLPTIRWFQLARREGDDIRSHQARWHSCSPTGQHRGFPLHFNQVRSPPFLFNCSSIGKVGLLERFAQWILWFIRLIYQMNINSQMNIGQLLNLIWSSVQVFFGFHYLFLPWRAI